MSTELESEAYAKDGVLTELLGDGPKVKMLTALLSEPDPDVDYNVTELARLAGVSRTTVYRHLEDFTELEVLVETRTSGASPRYKLNEDHPAVERLGQLEWELAEYRYRDR